MSNREQLQRNREQHAKGAGRGATTHFWTRGKVAVVGGAAATAGAIAGGFAAFGGSDNDPAGDRQPSTSVPANPSETEDLTPDQVAELAPKPTELTVERYGTDGDALTRAYMSQFNDWMTANATQEASDTFNPVEHGGYEQYVPLINKPVDDAYIDALFVSDWQERPQLRTAVADYIEGHANGVQINLMTTDSGNAEDLEPYQYGWEVGSVAVETESTNEIVVSYRWEGVDNSDMNRGDVISSEGSSDGVTGGATLTWVNEDGVWKIADHKYYAG